MRSLPRPPRVENKYNLTIEKIKELKVGNRELIGPPIFERSEYLSAWIIEFATGPSYDMAEYEIIIYDENSPKNAGQFCFNFSLHSDYDFPYTFNRFYSILDILGLEYLIIQESFLENINMMIDKGILVFL